MTASCSNSDSGGDVTPTITPEPTANSGGITFEDGPTFIGSAPDDTLTTIATGDFNADGDMDIALGAASADADDGPDAGKVYVFYSVADYGPGEVPVEDADAVFVGQAGDQAGRSLAAADLNGDRVDDLVIGAPAADAGDRADAGKVYVLLGNPVFEDVRAMELVPDAPAISGADAGDFFGYTLATGDFNDDGTADLAIGAFLGDGPDNDREDAGEVHIIYGGNPPANIDLAESELDAVIYGANAGDHLSEGLTSGDFDGNGRDDIIVAATFAGGDGAEEVGQTYILTDDLKSSIDLAGKVPGTRVVGIDEGDQLGHSLAAPDFNGDGFGDLLLGAVSADGPDNGEDLAGEVALVLGSTSPPDVINAADDAQIIYGVTASRLGRSVAAGDINGDGFDDALLGASEAPNTTGATDAGAVYVVFGGPSGQLPASTDLTGLAFYGNEGDNMATQVNGIPALAVADLNHDGLADAVIAAPRADEKRGHVLVMLTKAAK